MTTYWDQSDEVLELWERCGVLKPSHREEDLGHRDDDRFDAELEEEDTDVVE
jgi:hypothetical protein